MKRGLLRYGFALMVFLLILSACSSAGTTTESGTGNGTTPTEDSAVPSATEAVPSTETMPTEAMITEATGEEVANCIGVDTQALMTAGETLYAARCASCHGAEGEGQGDFPALTASESATVENAATLVTGYLSVQAHPKDVTPDDLAAVLTYVRGSFGNSAAAVCPADVQIPAAQ